MTNIQFELLARLLSLSGPPRGAARDVIVDQEAADVAADLHGCSAAELEQALDAVHRLEQEIRGEFVLHGPADFRVTVGHHDVHRMPGAMPALMIGQVVRLQAHSTERWIPVRIVAAPALPTGFYEGIIVKQLALGSKFQPGNRVRFSEDQVMMPEIVSKPSGKARRFRRG